MIEDAIKQIIGEDDFTRYMNPPTWDGIAEVKDIPGKGKWVLCPYCHKRLIKVLPETKIHMMPYKCKGSKCHGEFIVNVE